MPGKSAHLPVHVTCLEMSAPPKTNLPMPANIQTAIIRASEIPLHYYRYLYRQVGKRWHWYERLRMTDEELAAEIHDAKVNITILYLDGAPAGFFELLHEDGDTTRLCHFGLFERALGLGLGKWFLLQALYVAWQDNPKKVTVTTNSLDHPRALQLYQMMGFSPVSTYEASVHPLTEAELLALAKKD